MSAMRRVVITGLGLVTPLGCGVEASWSRLLAGKSGAGPITRFKVDDLAARIACDVPRGDGSDGTFNPDQWVDPKEQRRVDDFIVYALTAAQQAVTDSGYEPKTEEERDRAGVLIGSGIGGLDGIEQGAILLHEKGPRKLSPFFLTGPADQSGFGLCLDPVRLQGAQSFRGDGVLHRLARDRRRGAPDRAGRCRRDAGGRRRIGDLPPRHCGFRRLPGALDRLQRYAGKGLAPL